MPFVADDLDVPATRFSLLLLSAVHGFATAAITTTA